MIGATLLCAPAVHAQTGDAYLPSIPVPADDAAGSVDVANIPTIEVTGTISQISPEIRAPDDAPEVLTATEPASPAGSEELRAQMATFCAAIEQGCEAMSDLEAERLEGVTGGMDAAIDAIRNYPRTLRCEEQDEGEERCTWK